MHTDPDTGYLSVSYIEMLPVLLEAFNQHMAAYKTDKQDLLEQYNALKKQLDELCTRLQKTEGKYFMVLIITEYRSARTRKSNQGPLQSNYSFTKAIEITASQVW